jgi:hypothetical protein
MWRETPEQRLTYVKKRQLDLIAETAANRRPPSRATKAGRRRAALRLRLGALLIVIGRTLCDEDALNPRLARR